MLTRVGKIATLGRIDELVATGQFDRLLRSGARFAQTAVVLTAFENGDGTKVATRQLSPALALDRLWQEIGAKRVIGDLAAERDFAFDLERAAFLTVLHRLFDPGSDRAAEKWRHDLVIDGVGELGLHHLYRTMGWLGEELSDQSGRGLGPRTTKDLVEERLFALRNTLFSELSLVFLDTTSLYFEGAAARASANTAIPRTTTPISNRSCWPSSSTATAGRSAPSCGRQHHRRDHAAAGHRALEDALPDRPHRCRRRPRH